MSRQDTLKLGCNDDQYHALALAADQKTRGGGDTVKVSKTALAALLTDFGKAMGKLKECGISEERSA